MTEDEFYNLSLAEIKRQLKAFNKRFESNRRENYNNILLLSAAIASRFSSTFEFPSYEELYDNKAQSKKNIEQSKANFLQFAQANNRKYGGK